MPSRTKTVAIGRLRQRVPGGFWSLSARRTGDEIALGHGQFQAWTDKNLTCTRQTANTYMRLYENRAMLADKGDLSIRNAHKLLPGNDGKARPNVKRVTFEREAEAGLKAESEPESKAGPKAEPKAEPPKPQLDPDKHEIPEHLRPVFIERERFESLQQVESKLPRPGARPTPGTGFRPSGEPTFGCRRWSLLTFWRKAEIVGQVNQPTDTECCDRRFGWPAGVAI
jgi:hypothetical protein